PHPSAGHISARATHQRSGFRPGIPYPAECLRIPAAIEPAFDPSNSVWPPSCTSRCRTVIAPAGLAKMLVTPPAAVSAPPRAAARGAVVSCRIGAPASPLERSIVCAAVTPGRAARPTAASASRSLMVAASACRAQDHQALAQQLCAGLDDQDVHAVRQPRRLAPHIPLEPVRGQRAEVPDPEPGEVVERHRAGR